MTRNYYQPSADLAHFVERYWIVRWDDAKSTTFELAIAAAPNVTIAITSDIAEVMGLATSSSTHKVTGNGIVLGVTFKPGGFHPFFKKPMDRLTNQTVSLSNMFSSTRIKKITSELHQPETMLITALEKLLRSKRPEEDPNIAAIEAILQRIQEDKQLATVQDVCQAYDMSERTLQRTFQHYVGIGLRWIVAQYRTQDATDAAQKAD